MVEPKELTELIVEYDYDSSSDTSFYYGDADGADGTEIILRGHMPSRVFEVIGRCVPDLRYLTIVDPEFDPEMLSLLPNGIQWLILSAASFGDGGVKLLKRFDGLTELALDGVGLSATGWRALSELRLEDLDIESDTFKADYVSFLEDLPLRKLQLTGLAIRDGLFDSFPQSLLRSLTLKQCTFSKCAGAEFSKFDRLEHLWLWEPDLTDDSFSRLDLHHIQRFEMSASTVVPELMWQAICRMSSVSRLEFSHVPIRNQHIAGLRNLPNLEHIDVRTTEVTREGVRAFLQTSKSSPYVYALGFDSLRPFTKEDMP